LNWPSTSRQIAGGIAVFSQAGHTVARKFNQDYLDQLFSAPDFSKFVEINGYLIGSDVYDRSQPTYGFPVPVFVFKESLIWFSQSIRSGARTYYEATPSFRQVAMRDALKLHAPDELGLQYELGMKDWRHKARIARVSQWISSREDVCHRWLWHLSLEHRPEIEVLCGQITAH
jgi:hypothetical protein